MFNALKVGSIWLLPTSVSNSNLTNLTTISTKSFTYNGLTFVVIKCGKTVEFKIWDGACIVALNAYSKYSIGTIPDGYRPAYVLSKNISLREGVEGILDIQKNGAVSITPFGVIAAGSTPLIHEVYIS